MKKRKKKRNEYSQATVYNPQGKLIHTHTLTQEGGKERRERERQGRTRDFSA